MTAEKSIDLATEADFVLGKLTVRPSSREIATGDTAETLEPRVMQVLVALARRPGQVVSRDQLVALCWEGRAVGEDAIQRAIAKVRRLGEATNAFSIDTIPRVGYRLKFDSASPATPLPPATPPEPILAVLPFDNLSDDREMQFFSDGIADEILQALARTRGMKTIGRGSSFQFRGSDKAVRKVAEELGATHVLDGSVRRAGSRVRISVQLVDAATQTAAWASQFERDLSDVLRIQVDIASGVANALSAVLITRSPTDSIDPVSLELCLRSRSLMIGDVGSEAHAIPMLEHAVHRSPNYAQAWALLACCRGFLLHDPRDVAAYAAANAATEHALQLDPSNTYALEGLLLLKPPFREYETKIDIMLQAIARAPNDARASIMAAMTLCSVGRAREGVPHARVGYELEPLSPLSAAIYASLLASAGVTEEALRVLEDALQREPGAVGLWFTRAWVAIALDPFEKQHPFSTDLPLRAGMTPSVLNELRELLALTQHPQPLRLELVRRLLMQDRPALWLPACKLAVAIDCADAAFDALFAAIKGGKLLTTQTTPTFSIPLAIRSAAFFVPDAAALRRDPRFARVCAQLNLVDYWMSSGHWPDCADEVPYDFRAECEKALREIGR